MADGIFDFFGSEAGQARRRRLDEINRGISYYIPPELRGPLGLVAEMNPIEGSGRAGQAAQDLAAPGAAPMDRVGAGGRMLSEMAGILAPAAVAGRVGMPAAQALQEGLLGFSSGAQGVGRAVADRLNQPGPMPTVYSNPVMRAPDELPAPRNDAEAMAKQILDLRAAGRAGDVTDEMMAAADPQYMYFNTPLPMDEASRMARAGDRFNRDVYHGNSFSSRQNEFSVPNQRAYFAYDPQDAGDYASYATNQTPENGRLFGEGAQIQRMMVRANNRAQADDVNSAYEHVSGMDRASVSVDESWGPLHPDWSEYSTEVADELRNRGFDSVFHNDDSTPLNGSYIDSIAILDPPTNIRSRFARFDPEFRHLRNLSAGVGGLGLLAYPQEEY